MFRLKFKKDHGHYKIGQEVRIDPDQAKIFINGGYADQIGGEEKKMVEAAPENKSLSELKQEVNQGDGSDEPALDEVDPPSLETEEVETPKALKPETAKQRKARVRKEKAEAKKLSKGK